MLTTREWRELIESYSNPDVRAKVILGAVVSSHLYAVDIQDLLLHPMKRYEGLTWTKSVARTFLYNFDGFEGDMTTLDVDRSTGKVRHFPEHLDPFRRAQAEGCFREPSPTLTPIWTQRYHAFRTRWFERIVDYYRGSSTKVIFVQVPRWPMDAPLLRTLPNAPDLRDDERIRAPNVVFVDEHLAEDLEEPRYFYDMFHVNKLAREAFTTRFGRVLRKELGDLPP